MVKSQEKRFYVYAYLDPRKPGKYTYGEYSFDFEPFYIGKGTRNRKNKHIINVKNNNQKNTNGFLFSKIKKILNTGLKPKIIILKNKISNKRSLKLEIEYIKSIGRKDLKSGPLCNFTDGGEGSLNATKNTTKKRVETKIKNKTLNHTEETKNKMSIASKGKSKSKKHKKALSKAWEKRKLKFLNGIPEQQRLNASKIRKGKINFKIFKVTNPTGEIFYTLNGLTLFCEQNNLTQRNMSAVARGKRKHHKGWKCEYTQ